MSKLNPQKASAYVGPGVLRKGGKITPVPNGPLIKKKGPFKGSTLKNGGPIKGTTNQPNLPKLKKLSAKEMKAPAKVDISKFNKAKSGTMIKRADGSMSRRGLWDNIRANKGSGKKPTAAMLKQEKKIKAKSKK